MDKNWLIRTKSNHILGPISKEKVLELYNNGSIKPDDEVCSGNGYWFFIREDDMVDRFLVGTEPQGFNPISEAKDVLTTPSQPSSRMSGATTDDITMVGGLNISMLKQSAAATTSSIPHVPDSPPQVAAKPAPVPTTNETPPSDVKKKNNLIAKPKVSANRQKDSLMNDMAKIGPILDKVDSAVNDIKIIVADVKDGKGTVGKLLRDDAVVDQVSQTLSSVNRLVNRINNIEADIGLSTGANTRTGSDTRFDLDIYPAPERFFRIGIVTNEFGPQTERETETVSSTDGGAETTTEVRKINKSDVKFNFQIGRRIQRFGLRAGLIESTGGVGIDYFFPDFGIRTGLEMFDYQKEAGPNLRLMTEIKIWNVLFARVAGEDLISKDNKQSATISLGLRFSDQDLAALIGIFAR